MEKKKKNPGADGTARGAGTSESSNKRQHTKNGQPAQGAVQKAFDACRAKLDAKAAQTRLVAERVRAVAKKHNAVRCTDNRCWDFFCPSCGATAFVYDDGRVTVSKSDCVATKVIQQIVRDAIRDNGVA